MLVSGPGLAQTPHPPSGNYTYTLPTPDGTGKYSFGREIAQVMGHRSAGWLERKSGIQEEVLHKMTQQQAIAEMQAVGLVWVEPRHFLPTQDFMVFEKPDRPASH